MMRAPLNIAELRATGVADVLAADHLDRERLADRHVDGVREPSRTASTRIIQTWTTSVTVSTARIDGEDIITVWVAMRVWRFGQRVGDDAGEQARGS